MGNKKPNCYECKYRGSLPGDCHSRCLHPDKETIEVKGKETGIRRGWFSWPYDFDPVWLEKCNGFEQKKVT